ncbi:UDP-N-acetylglucosamine diphosphorylase/glucosamine-1-phosphate N-acetyltransferase [Sphingorhabdus lutea]|uniref:Bifunctional protein GlmU n=1 Tax=Sphingorhabdus lutea TaxID=1913578 RepID=A0A1L3JB16_9SPHN|nr:bifunctional UDP-N-acetylglucosamine diphosphorylase/glucosamine-1-phosphate N-acetyltransferase GlmU [Sphingorhabdus lutea]APG62253.1 UDP-N-acetylglucosamine diphosphorylase/glucosamine-1-phosphate N-acetyltransferase [Sphingorhabdus lutea]
MSKTPLAAIILAAGQGTRMKSDLHKVLHPLAGKPMVHHLLDSVSQLNVEKMVVIVGSRKEQLEASLAPRIAEHKVVLAEQSEMLGTGHAVAQASGALAGFEGNILILFGDVPLTSAATMQIMLERLEAKDKPQTVVLGFRHKDPAAYGRIIADEDQIIHKMVEFKDANSDERKVNLCNSGLMAVRSADLFDLLDQIDNDNAAGEYYLPDIVMLPGPPSAVVIADDEKEVTGVNSRAELAALEQLWQQNRRATAMADGASMIAPDTVWFSHDTKIGRDVVIEPNVVFGAGVEIADKVTIHAFSHLEGAKVASGAKVGPYARLRPGAVMEEDSKVGNFVEVKKAVLGKGAKANHLSYIGDANVGAGANIGAGTITCNYDGYFKYQTNIGEGAFVGSNSALVAPVNIGRGAIVAAGSTVTRDVGDGELRLVRAEQAVKPGWADRFNDAMRKKKGG